MKRILQKSLSRLQALLLLAVMFVAGGSAAWADETPTQKAVRARMYDNSFRQIGNDFVVEYEKSGTTYMIHDFFGTGRTLTVDVNDLSSMTMEGGLKSGDYYYLNDNWSASSFNGDAASSVYGNLSSFDNTDNVLTIKYYSAYEYNWHSYKIYFNEELSSVEYTVYINDAPDGATVTLDGKPVSNGDTYTTAKELSLSSLNASEPEDYYAECSYDNYVFTVNYKEYYHYMVGVTGCEENGAGVKVNGGWQTYSNGEKINSKVVLTASDLSAATVNGYVVDNIEMSALTGKNATITVSYSVAPVVPYTVTITGMPEGASVKIEEEVFTESGTHESCMTLSSYDVTINNCPDTHFTNDRNEWYDEEHKAFNIVFSEYLVYTVAVDENGAYTGADAGVKYNGNTYHATETFKSKTALNAEDVQPAEVDDHTGTVTLANTVFTVSYTKNDFITFAAEKSNLYTFEETKDGVTLNGYNGWNYYTVNGQGDSHIVLTSSAAPIEKVEIEYINWGKPSAAEWYYAVDDCDPGDISTIDDITTWTGNTNSLELWQSNNQTAYVSLIKVYLAGPAAPATVGGKMDGKFYGTYYADYAWEKPQDISVYYVSSVENGAVTLTEITGDVIAANVGVILVANAEANNVTITKSTESGAHPYNNYLNGVTVDTEVNAAEGSQIFKLAYNNDETKIGFYWGVENGVSLSAKANKAYLEVPGATPQSNGLSILFDGEATGIQSISTENNDAIYNLQGQRINATKAGVYVKNGKKFIVK